ncbi:MAG: DNA replication/repair protein RecF [Acholeplasmataceae bacterium]|nr:DNA replication/repair protein RecF [Acidaminococcaceae bacterium]NLY83087.1 DNA replication/repair protein RecF [Acholeplasmataceae bacterium]
MKIEQINLVNFRNYRDLKLNISGSVNVFYGNNAQGKTNLLESIFYAAFGLSHRTGNEEDLVGMGRAEMAAEVCFSNYAGEHSLKVKRRNNAEKNKKEVMLNGNVIKSREHYGTFNVVMFSPEDLQLVKGEPALRRRFLDMEIAQTNRSYYANLVKYNRIVQQRNKLLKEARENGINEKLIEVWDEELASGAAAIMVTRIRVLQKINELAGDVYKEIASRKEELVVNYELKTNSSALILSEEKSREEWRNWYLESLKERRAADIARGSTGIGPHRDDLVLTVNEDNLKSFGSQGQQRSSALALKLAEMEYVKEETGEYPVLLLDDVMSELDSERRRQILHFIDGRVQTFITVNDKNLIPVLPENKYFRVHNGIVCEEKA